MRPDVFAVPWRVGRKLGRTIYAQVGGEASNYDELLGMVDNADLARHICEVHNAAISRRMEGQG